MPVGQHGEEGDGVYSWGEGVAGVDVARGGAVVELPEVAFAGVGYGVESGAVAGDDALVYHPHPGEAARGSVDEDGCEACVGVADSRVCHHGEEAVAVGGVVGCADKGKVAVEGAFGGDVQRVGGGEDDVGCEAVVPAIGEAGGGVEGVFVGAAAVGA